MEGENPTRRYKWFRPRQAAWAYTPTQSAPVNFGAIALYNNSSGVHLLVVRNFYNNLDSTSAYNVFRRQSNAGTVLPNAIFRLIPGEAAPPGQLIFSDEALVTTGIIADTNVTSIPWGSVAPMMILPPGWAIVMQARTQAQGVGFGYLYEFLEPDELDYAFGL